MFWGSQNVNVFWNQKGTQSEAVWESILAHLELSPTVQGELKHNLLIIIPQPSTICTICILISVHFMWNKFHEKEQKTRSVRVLRLPGKTAAYTSFLSPPISHALILHKIRDRQQPRSLVSVCWGEKKATTISSMWIYYFHLFILDDHVFVCFFQKL